MRKSTISALVPALALVLSGCGKKAETPAATEVADKDTASSLKRGNGNGTVTAIDVGKGSVTLDHGAVPDLNWPPMEMSFKAKPDQLAGLQVGDKVAFEIGWDGKTGSVTSIRKAQ